MPWCAYVCDTCGQEAQLRTSAQPRDAEPPHRLHGGCLEGRLRRVSAARGSGPSARGGPHAPAARGGGAGDAEVPSPAEVAQRLLPALPALSSRLRLAEVVGLCGGDAAPYAEAFGDELAAEVAAAPRELLAREPRLLDLLLLARRRGRLATAEFERLAGDDGLLARLLGSALGWPAAGSSGPGEAPRFAWAALRSLAGAPFLRARIRALAARSTGILDAWDRLAVDAAAAELEAGGDDGVAPPRPP